jgi:hypothetical protein
MVSSSSTNVNIIVTIIKRKKSRASSYSVEIMEWHFLPFFSRHSLHSDLNMDLDKKEKEPPNDNMKKTLDPS